MAHTQPHNTPTMQVAHTHQSNASPISSETSHLPPCKSGASGQAVGRPPKETVSLQCGTSYIHFRAVSVLSSTQMWDFPRKSGCTDILQGATKDLRGAETQPRNRVKLASFVPSLPLLVWESFLPISHQQRINMNLDSSMPSRRQKFGKWPNPKELL